MNTVPCKETKKEIAALELFSDKNFAYTLHLLHESLADLDPEDVKYMPGGWVRFIFMTKLPAEQIKYNNFWALTVEKREEIRQVFKVALM